MYNTQSTTASSAQECVDLVVAAEPAALAISFELSTNDCKYSTSIYSYYPLDPRYQPESFPEFYLRTDNVTKELSESDCLTKQDAEYLIAKLSFGDEQCVTPATYDSTSGLCVAASFPYELGTYMAGRSKQDEQYALSRDQALESVKYACANEDSSVPIKMIFDGAWYCYHALNEQVSLAGIKDNSCAATLGSGAGPIKTIEPRELGFLYDWAGKITYLGLYLQDATTYVWYDGSAATDLPWAVGRPLGDPANDLVYVDSDLTVVDGNDSGGDGLYCKCAASSTGYDPTVKFA